MTPDGGALAPRYHWVLPEPHPLSAATIEDARGRGLSARALRVLSRRGPLDEAGLAARFDPPERGLHDPLLLPDAQVVLRRVAEARARSERVMVVGDFDADGLTGLAILLEAFRWLGLEAEGHVPDRAAEGHGLSLAAVERARERGCSLAFTVDTGSTSHAEVEAARERGIDVIITDHHVVPAVPPAALALVNPQRHDSRYPDACLSGAGVAFKVAQLLMGQHPGGAGEALGLADLAAIGLVADVMPIAGENRCIVRLGLRRLSEARRPGLAALMASARLDPARISLEDLGFALAPRINAMGRVGDPAVAAELLAAADRATADVLAARLEEANDLRRQLTADALVEARAAAEATAADPFVVVSGDWPLGVIGLMAGRLAEELGRPALVISEQVDPWRGSARSAGAFDLVAAFDACADLFERYGGHPAAAGCHVPPERVEELRGRLVSLAAGRPPVDRRPSLLIDLVQSAESADYVLLRELAPLEGAGERPPLIGVAGLAVIRARGANGGHTQVTLRRGREVVDAICFGRPDLAERLGEGQEVDVVARLVSRTFAGLETLQLEVRDVAPTGRLAGLRAAARDRREHPVAIHRPASGGPAR